jgi:hypothetical protein
MKESYREGVATHSDPESCGSSCKGSAEAWTGEQAGRVLSCEIHAPRRELWAVPDADAVEVGGRPYRACRYREESTAPAQSETPRTSGRTLHGNREIPRLSTLLVGRMGKSKDTRP